MVATDVVIIGLLVLMALTSGGVGMTVYLGSQISRAPRRRH